MKYTIAVVGAASSIGRAVISALSREGFRSSDIVAITTREYMGKKISCGSDADLVCKCIDDCSFTDIDVAVFVDNDAVSERYAEMVSESGCLVIDTTYLFRREEDIPLVIHDVNKEVIPMYKDRNIISVPSVSSQIAAVLSPLRELSEIKRVVLSTYHSVSHLGKGAMSELYDQTKAMFMNRKTSFEEFPKQISFNCIPCVGSMGDVTSEESNIAYEVQRVLGSEVNITATCVYVPVFVSHSNAINVEFCDSVNVEDVVNLLGDHEGILVVDSSSKIEYVTPIDCVNDEEIYVSRIRKDDTVPSGINMWVVYDNICRGAANIVSIIKSVSL
ncbi:aspartate-semialdehyde dehydrogenase [Anaplasma bovis]|uniref:aspartate-semialdehyde dehydrogenase n=1 Tax=Anaplasma bovis TaxID=186733 RepID=UPI002FF3FC08